jgi:sugar/nucleoside kinase (ribokinase family)
MPGYFRQSLLGITPQGWFRSWDAAGKVSHLPKPIPVSLAALPTDSLVVLSQEDLDFDSDVIAEYARVLPRLVVTNGPGYASIFEGGNEVKVPANQAVSTDPTGAGDVFAASVFICYSETRDLLAAVRFAHAAAALSISATGTAAIPTRGAIDRFLSTTSTR